LHAERDPTGGDDRVLPRRARARDSTGSEPEPGTGHLDAATQRARWSTFIIGTAASRGRAREGQAVESRPKAKYLRYRADIRHVLKRP